MGVAAGTVYIAGPMTGREGLNYESFHAVAAWLRGQGRNVVSPAEFGLSADTPWADCMRVAARAVSYCSEVLLLPGWKNSRGACKEADLAETFAMPVRELALDDIKPGKSLDWALPAMDLSIRTIATLIHAETLVGNVTSFCGHSFHPDRQDNRLWGCSPYGLDFLACADSFCPSVDVLAGHVKRLIQGEVYGRVPAYCQSPVVHEENVIED